MAQQDQIEVYVGETGYICIVQTDGLGEESSVVVDPSHAEAIASAIINLATKAAEARQMWVKEGDK